MEGEGREEFYNFMKGLAPSDAEETEKLKNAAKELERKKRYVSDYEKSCRDFAGKADTRTAKVVMENAEGWLHSLRGNHEIYGFVLKKLGELAEESPKVARATAGKLDGLLDNLAHRYEQDYTLASVFSQVMDGVAELAGTDTKSAEALIDHAWKWPEMTESQDLSYYFPDKPGNSPDRVQLGDYYRIIHVIKEAARNGDGTELIEATEELLRERGGNVKAYFDYASKKYRITGKFLKGPLDFLQYEPEYLRQLVSKFKRHSFGIEERTWDSMAGEVERLVAFREAYEPAEGGAVFSTEREKDLKGLIEYAEDLAGDMRSYRSHSAGPGDLKIIDGRLQILKGMADNYGHSHAG